MRERERGGGRETHGDNKREIEILNTKERTETKIYFIKLTQL